MQPLIQLKQTTPIFLVAVLLGCFALSPRAQAVVPAPDGAYPGGNTAEGQNALFHLTTGGYNTAVGYLSLGANNTTGSLNTAVGAGTLLANTAGRNTATGAAALLSNTTGSSNTANGTLALFRNQNGINNTAIGDDALYSNVDGINNVAIGDSALLQNTGGFENTAIGHQALNSNFGAGNTAVGYFAGQNLTTGNDNIDIGADGVAGESGVIRIGRAFIGTAYIAGIRGVTTQNADAIPVLIDSAGQLGTASSSRRYKQDISPMDKSSEAILALRPVRFHYNSDKTRTPQFGLIAEEVAEVNRDLVVRDKNGEIYTVRYDAVNAMLLNEFLKEHKKVQGLEATVAQQQKGMEMLTAQLKEQAAQIQKVSAQLEVSKAAPQTVLNNQ
jgi:hypothetical protein